LRGRGEGKLTDGPRDGPRDKPITALIIVHVVACHVRQARRNSRRRGRVVVGGGHGVVDVGRISSQISLSSLYDGHMKGDESEGSLTRL
jgi:hypothetical protein